MLASPCRRCHPSLTPPLSAGERRRGDARAPPRPGRPPGASARLAMRTCVQGACPDGRVAVLASVLLARVRPCDARALRRDEWDVRRAVRAVEPMKTQGQRANRDGRGRPATPTGLQGDEVDCHRRDGGEPGDAFRRSLEDTHCRSDISDDRDSHEPLPPAGYARPTRAICECDHAARPRASGSRRACARLLASPHV
jgi:hypothetical protein